MTISLFSTALRLLKDPGEFRVRLAQLLWDQRMRYQRPVINSAQAREPSRRFTELFFINHTNYCQLQRSLQGYPQFILENQRDSEEILAGKLNLLGFTGLNVGPAESIDFSRDYTTGAGCSALWWKEALCTDVDLKCVWELNRLQFLLPLGIRFLLTKEERCMAFATRTIARWIDTNPFCFGVNWGSSLELAYRAICLIWVHQFFLFSPDWKRYHEFLHLLELHGDFIENNLSIYHSPNTHITGEALGLLYLGLFLNEDKKTLRWRKKAVYLLDLFMAEHLLEDGGYMERSFWYHSYTAEIYLHYYSLLRLFTLGNAERVRSKLDDTYHFLQKFKTPDGNIPRFGDDDGGKLLRFSGGRVDGNITELLASLDRFLAKENEERLHSHPVALFFYSPQARAEMGTFHQNTKGSPLFAASGYYQISWPSAAGRMQLVFDAGELGWRNCGHGHADALSFVLQVGKTPVIVDPGTFSYKSVKRNRYRGAEAHATLSIDGDFPAGPSSSPFHWHRKYRCIFLGEEQKDTYHVVAGRLFFDEKRGEYHDREICFFSAGCVVIKDSVFTPEPVKTTRRFPLAGTDWQLEGSDSCRSVAGNCIIKIINPCHEQMSLAPFFLSRYYGVEENATLLQVDTDKDGGNCFFTLINVLANQSPCTLFRQGETTVLRLGDGITQYDLADIFRKEKKGCVGSVE